MNQYNEFKYTVISETEDGKTRQLYWNIAFGLQDVDNIKPSEYMIQLAKENVEGKKAMMRFIGISTLITIHIQTVVLTRVNRKLTLFQQELFKC